MFVIVGKGGGGVRKWDSWMYITVGEKGAAIQPCERERHEREGLIDKYGRE